MIRNLQFPRLQERAVRKVLAAGFVLVIVLLGLAAAVAEGQSRRIRRSVEQLIRDQLVISGLVHDVRLEEDVLVDLLRRVAGGDPALEDHRVLLEKLDLTRL